MGVKKVTLFIGIINCFTIKDNWEVAGFARIPVTVDKFPIERFSWGNGVKFLQDGISVVDFATQIFLCIKFLSLLYLILHLASSVLRHREKTLLRCLIRRFRSLVIQG